MDLYLKLEIILVELQGTGSYGYRFMWLLSRILKGIDFGLLILIKSKKCAQNTPAHPISRTNHKTYVICNVSVMFQSIQSLQICEPREKFQFQRFHIEQKMFSSQSF